MIYCDIDIFDKISLKKEYEDIIKRVIEEVCKKEAPKLDIYVSVSIVSKEEIKAVNKEQRNIDSVTDVLSFPCINFDNNYKMINVSLNDYDREINALVLGDIVICLDKIEEQAKEYGHSKIRELSYLTAHSMYHLFGYDHTTEPLKRDMRKKEEEILEEINAKNL